MPLSSRKRERFSRNRAAPRTARAELPPRHAPCVSERRACSTRVRWASIASSFDIFQEGFPWAPSGAPSAQSATKSPTTTTSRTEMSRTTSCRPSRPFRESGADEMLTTNQGLPINDDQNSLKAGERGPSLLEDFILREKITHFDHERIPERVVHARGAGGARRLPGLRVAGAVHAARSSCRTRRSKTPVFVRFSTVAGSRGSTDLARDVRGFAVKFYTQEGNFDLVGNNIPVFFIQDAMKFPDLDPRREARAAQRDSAGGIGPRHVLGLHLADARIDAHDHVGDVGPRHPAQLPHDGRLRRPHVPLRQRRGRVALREVPLEAAARRALGARGTRRRRSPARTPTSTAATCGRRSRAAHFPEWELGVQIVEEKDEHKFDFDLLDPTKIIPEELVPVQRIGKLTLNRNPDNFFAETEQVAFHPGHIVPGHRLHRTIRCCRAGCSPTPTRSSSASAGPTSTRSRSTGRSRPCTTTSATATCGRRSTAAARATSRTRSAAAARSRPAPDGRLRELPRAHRRREVRGRGAKASSITSARRRCSSTASREPEQNHIVKALRFELGKVEAAAHPRAHGRDAGARRSRTGRAGGRRARIARDPERERPLNRSMPADGNPKDFEPRRRRRRPRSSARRP